MASIILISFLLSHAGILLAEECTTGFSVVAPELAVPGKTTAVLVTLHGPTSFLPVNVTLRLLGDEAEEMNQQLVETTQEIRESLRMYPPASFMQKKCTKQFTMPPPKGAGTGPGVVIDPGMTIIIPVYAIHFDSKYYPDPERFDPNRFTEEEKKLRPKCTFMPFGEGPRQCLGHGILPLEVPNDATGSYILQTLVNCSGVSNSNSAGDGSCSLQSSSQMKLVGPVRDVIIRPAKHAYRPADTVSFWVLALDHDLQIASGVIGTVSVRDPAGTKVALWDQVPLDEGVKPFSLPLSERATLGRWRLQVDVENIEFSVEVDVSAIGSGFGLPDIAAAEEHYVELRFGREMRRRYKPGLPFIGKVEAMSTEKSVRVRVKVYDNTTSIYSQDIEISQGEGTFIVPAILADSDVIALQAELVSVEGKEIESHYVLAREPIHKWNSSSDCYLLIEGVEHTLQPDEEAHVAILSTCPCEKDLHYVITTDGRVTDWAQRRYEDPVPPTTVPPTSHSGDGAAICRLNFSFSVRSVMAPVSQLLVYYVTPQGEPVSDVISFDVKLLQRQVYVNLEEREYWYPNQALDVEIVAEHSSLVCLIGGRSGNGNDVRFDPRISESRTPSPETGEIDFLEAGVSFFQRQCIRRGDSDVFAVSYRQRGSGAGPANRRRPQESLVGGEPFDMLWMWKCFNYTSEIAASGLTLQAPDEAGRWSLWALTLASSGLRFSSPVTVTVFRPLQAEFRLPPSLRVGESLEVDVKIGNNINTCMDVTALLALSEGAKFLTNGLLYVTERLRLGPHGATSLVVKILVSTPGLKNMTVEVNGYTSSSCDVAGATYTNESLAGAVVRSATVLVRPEGLVRTDTESAYFCANENMVISPAGNFKYEWLNAPRNRAALVFELRSSTSGPSHVALSDSRYPTERMYQLVLGDSGNSVSWIGRGKHGYGVQLASVATPGVLTENQWRTFWLSWERNTISFGEGTIPHNRTLLKWRMDKKLKVQYIGFASSWGTATEFRVWNYNDEAGFSQVLHLDIPRSVVPGSESGCLSVTGGLALPSPNHLKRQTSSLQGSIASLTPLLLLEHLGQKANESMKQEILSNLPGYIQSVLSFRNADNSFSEHHMLSSHSATVQILEALTKTQTFFSVDPDLVQEVKRWIQLRQEDDGSFTPLPADVKIQNDSASLKAYNISNELLRFEHTVEITAETVIILYEVGIENQMDHETIRNAQKFLESNIGKVQLSSGISALALALILIKSPKAHVAMEALRNVSTTEEGDFGWPHPLPRRDAADWLYETETGRTLKEPILTTSEDFKASIYSLTAFCLIEDLKSAEAVARYLFYRSHMLDRHTELVYPSVKAFSKFSSLAYDKHRSLTVSLATSGMELTDTLELKTDHAQQILHLPSLPTKVFVYATGAGCATIQGHTSYSTYAAVGQTPLLDLWSKVLQEINADRSSVEEIEGKLPMLKIKTCFRWKNQNPSGVLRLEISLFSGYELFSVSSMPSDAEGNISDLQHGSHANELWFVFANVTSKCPICVQYIVRSAYVISSLRPAFARVYPADREDLAAETFFHSASGSELLNGITEDDLITWFGKNDTKISKDFENISPECKHLTTSTTETIVPSTTDLTTDTTIWTTDSSTIETTTDLIDSSTDATTSAAEVIPLDELSVTTYTINVDSNSISNNITKPLPTELNETESVTLKNISETDIPTTIRTPIPTTDNLEGNEIKINKTNIVAVIVKNKIILNKKIEQLPTKTYSQKMNPKIKLQKQKAKPTTTTTTSTEKTVTTTEKLTTLPTKEAITHEVRHINTEIHEVPVEYINEDKTEDQDNKPSTFLPENRENKFLVVDKDALWGMLKEVVHDELDKKVKINTESSKVEDGKKLRSQGFT